VMAAFGCNYQGDIDPDHVVGLVQRLMQMAADHGLSIELIQLADTMGWATPVSIRRMVGKIRGKWPDQRINLHLHDTRGLGLANALAAMELGVDDFDSAVAGLGGCPYAGFKDAPGNIATEDLVHLCQEIGVETGVGRDHCGPPAAGQGHARRSPRQLPTRRGPGGLSPWPRKPTSLVTWA